METYNIRLYIYSLLFINVIFKKMGLISKLFGKSNQEYLGKKVEFEKEDYIPLCTLYFFSQVSGKPFIVDSNNNYWSGLDKRVLPRIMVGAILGSGIPCDQTCPGYTPLPVDDFPVDIHYVRCKRFIPKNMVPHDTKEEWEVLREYALKGDWKK